MLILMLIYTMEPALTTALLRLSTNFSMEIIPVQPVRTIVGPVLAVLTVLPV
jgi:hypothetical protein